MDEILFLSIKEINELMRSRQISADELLSLTLRRIERFNGLLNAFVSVQRPDKVRSSPPSRSERPLEGIPVSVKDLVITRDFPTTAGSRVFGDGIRSSRDALIVQRLKRAGAIIVGKTNLHEFAYGVTNENAHYGAVRNPWNLERVSGGSSGGSGAAVAAGLSFASIGSDTRGSIRIPSSFCGITGLKPSRGLIPMKGVIPLSSTLDHVGPMTRTVRDAALLLQVLSGPRRRSFPAEDASGLRVGLLEQYMENLDSDVKDVVLKAIQTLVDSGIQIGPVCIPLLKEAHEASRVIASAEALAYHEQFISTRTDGYDPKVLQRLKEGAVYTATDLVRALQIREDLRKRFRSTFRGFDCLLGASVPCVPPRIGENFLEISGRREEIVENLVRMNAAQNVAGVPALVVPCGFTSGGFPVGLQMLAGEKQEQNLFKLGVHFQEITEWHRRQPPLADLSTQRTE